MEHHDREKLIGKLIADGQWDAALSHAKALPSNFDHFQQWPSMHEEGLPNDIIHKILDHMDPTELKDSGFLYEMSHNLMGHHDTDTVKRLANAAASVDHDDSAARFTKHPAYQLTPEEDNLKAVHNFWKSYEKKTEPHHWAAVKSLFSGKPEEIKHRDKTGRSDDFYIVNGRHIYSLKDSPTVHLFDKPNTMYNGEEITKVHHVIPSLRQYAQHMQNKVLSDENIRKRYFNNEPYVKVYRGIGGHYAKTIRDAAKFQDTTQGTTHEHKKMNIPVTPFTSWSTDPEMAERFATGRGVQLDLPNHGVVIGKWMPLKHLLHSGMHSPLPGVSGQHPEESELVFGHPSGKLQIHTNDLKYQIRDTSLPDNSAVFGGQAPSKFVSANPEQKLAKSLKTTALNLGVAAAMLGIPHQLAQEPEVPHTITATQNKPKIKPLPGLQSIAMIESSHGKNTKHKTTTKGLNAGTTAIGTYGIMPLQAIEIVQKDPELAEKHPEFLSYDHKKDAKTISDQILTNPDFETKLANSHWKRLHRIFDGNEGKMAHAWRYGITGTQTADENNINTADYVKKYFRYKSLKNLEQPKTPLQKNEHTLPPEIHNVIKFKSLEPETSQNQQKEEEINHLISNKAFHTVPGMGHFTHSSFVVGTNHENSWLIKVESGSRPGIASAKEGLQPIKESAFLDVARNVFKLNELVPDVLLGELIYESDAKPAAAIKMLSTSYKLASDVEDERPGFMLRVLEKYRKSGVMHKALAMLYILGDGDAHGKNLMTDGYFIKLIDHGSSFANEKFDPHNDHNIFVPYIMRVGRIKNGMSPEEKKSHAPKIDNLNIKKDLSAWILSLNYHNLADKLNYKGIDPQPSVDRLKKLQNMVSSGMEPDEAINHLWV